MRKVSAWLHSRKDGCVFGSSPTMYRPTKAAPGKAASIDRVSISVSAWSTNQLGKGIRHHVASMSAQNVREFFCHAGLALAVAFNDVEGVRTLLLHLALARAVPRDPLPRLRSRGVNRLGALVRRVQARARRWRDPSARAVALFRGA